MAYVHVNIGNCRLGMTCCNQMQVCYSIFGFHNVHPQLCRWSFDSKDCLEQLSPLSRDLKS